jgi:hypothetical protein
VIGVLPVPPVVILPTIIIGIPTLIVFRKPVL